MLDLVVTHGGASGTGSVLLGSGDGTFQMPNSIDTGLLATAVVAADFTGDGKPDLAVTNSGGTGKTVSVLQGKGNGMFQDPRTFEVDFSPSALAVGDFNRDGKPDLAVANTSSNTMTVLINDTGELIFENGFELP